MNAFNQWFADASAAGVTPLHYRLVAQLLDVTHDQPERATMIRFLREHFPDRVHVNEAKVSDFMIARRVMVDAVQFLQVTEPAKRGGPYTTLAFDTPWWTEAEERSHRGSHELLSVIFQMGDGPGVRHPLKQKYDHALAFVEVINSTPEPDGTFKRYYLRIPPRFAVSPHAAVAWTFSYAEHGYAVTQET